MAMMECKGCGQSVSDGLPYCPSCGRPIPRRLAPFETNSETVCIRRWRRIRNGFFGIGLFLMGYGLLGLLPITEYKISILTPFLLVLSLVGGIQSGRRLRHLDTDREARTPGDSSS